MKTSGIIKEEMCYK